MRTVSGNHSDSVVHKRLHLQVGREAEVDCALAELYVRGLATERLVKDQHQAEIFNTIYTRINEVCMRLFKLGFMHVFAICSTLVVIP